MRCRAFSVLMMTGILLTTMFGMAWSAVPDPPGCFGIDVDSSLSPDKGTAYHINETVHYTVEFMNNPFPDNCDMENVFVEFFPPGPDGQPSAVPVLLDGPISFPADGTTLTYNSGTDPELAVSLAGMNPDVSTVVARATLTGDLQDITGLEQTVSTQVGILLLQPCIQITKTPDVEVTKCEDTVNYTIVLTNCSETTPVFITSVIDSLLGNLTGSFPGSLDPGEASPPVVVPYVVGSGPDECETAEILTNTVTVNAEDSTGADACDPAIAPDSICEATAEVALIQPDFTIEKTCEVTGQAPTYHVVWTITLTNTGDWGLDVTVNDSDLAIIDQVVPLPIGATETIIVETDIDCDPVEPIVLDNTVTAIATLNPQVLDNVLERSDDSQCVIEPCPEPCIQITKEPDVEVTKCGDEVNYEICLTNCSDTEVALIVSVTDTLLGDLTGLFPPALEPGQTVCAVVPYVVGSNPIDECETAEDYDNTVTVVAEGSTGADACAHQDADCDATAVVGLIQPDLEIVKDCVVVGEPGEQSIDYTITITNTGNWGLLVTVTDSDIVLPAVVIPLPIGGSETITASLIETECDTTYTNIATAIATLDPPVLDNVLERSDDSTCTTDPCEEVTRTPGYWFTHPVQLLAAFECITGNENTNNSTIVLCDGCEVNAYDAMAIFWRTSGGNRPTLAQHILAAMFNECMFGSSAGSAIEDGLAVLCNPDATSDEIGYAIMPLDEFNNSGSDLPFPDGFVNSRANPRQSKSMASDGTVPDCAAGKNIKD